MAVTITNAGTLFAQDATDAVAIHLHYQHPTIGEGTAHKCQRLPARPSPQNLTEKGPVGNLEVETEMAATRIEWTDATWNPVAGCSILAAGCKHCYAMGMAKRLEAMGVKKYSGLTRQSGGRTVWNGVVREDAGALSLPHTWKKSRKIFVNSMSDLFHERVNESFIMKVWQVMRDTPRHNYQILTKRPERMAEILLHEIGSVLPNVWLGTSVENSDAIGRLDDLRRTPAAIRFVSFEPLIGAVGTVDLGGIDWAIVGGESGRSARPIREQWVDEIYTQCVRYETAFFFKQWGTWGKDNKRRSKSANGREYRGRIWDDMPTTLTAV